MENNNKFWTKKKTLGLAAALSASALLFAPTVFAHKKRMGRHNMQAKMMHMLHHVDASDAQKEKAKAVFQKYGPKLKEQRKAHAQSRRQMRKLLLTDKVDRTKAERLRQDFLKEADVHSATLRDMLIELSEVLTPEQRKKVAARMEKFEKRRQKRWEHKKRRGHKAKRKNKNL